MLNPKNPGVVGGDDGGFDVGGVNVVGVVIGLPKGCIAGPTGATGDTGDTGLTGLTPPPLTGGTDTGKIGLVGNGGGGGGGVIGAGIPNTPL